jgi:hypothetical protein
MNETGAAARHLDETIKANATVAGFIGDRFYHVQAPEDAVYPFATYSAAPGSSDQPTGGSAARLVVEARWLVLVFHDQNDPDLVRRIAGALDAALVGSTGVVTIDDQAYHVLTVYREAPFERSGPVDGEFYLNMGGYYRTPCYAIL